MMLSRRTSLHQRNFLGSTPKSLHYFFEQTCLSLKSCKKLPIAS